MYLHDHPALARIPAKQLKGCLALWALAESWATRWSTDGFVPARQVELLGGTRGEAELLVSSGLWEDYPDGYLFRTWDTPVSAKQPAPAEPETSDVRREKARVRMQRLRTRREQTANSDANEGANGDAGDCEHGSEQREHSANSSQLGGRGGSLSSPSDLSSLSGSPSPLGSESTQQAGCNAGAREEAPQPGRLRFELEELVRAEFSQRGTTSQKASAGQWLDGCRTVQEALDARLYPDARSALEAFAAKLVDAVAAKKPPSLGLALQQVQLGEQLRPALAGGRQLSPLALAALERRRAAEGT